MKPTVLTKVISRSRKPSSDISRHQPGINSNLCHKNKLHFSHLHLKLSLFWHSSSLKNKLLYINSTQTYNDVVQIGDQDVRKCPLHHFFLWHALKAVHFPLDFLEGLVDLLLSFSRRSLFILLGFLGFGSGFGSRFRFAFGFGLFVCLPCSLSFSRCLWGKTKHFYSMEKQTTTLNNE